MFDTLRDKPIMVFVVGLSVSLIVIAVLLEVVRRYDEDKFKSELDDLTARVQEETDRREKINKDKPFVPDKDLFREPTLENPSEDLSVYDIAADKYYFTSGPYSGMTLGQAVKEWNRQSEELDDRDVAYLDKLIAHSNSIITDTDKEVDALLSMFKLFSSEQLEHMRNEALRMYPKEVVNEFFSEINNLDSHKSFREIQEITSQTPNSIQASNAVYFEIKVEREQIKRDRERLAENKPSNFLHLLTEKE